MYRDDTCAVCGESLPPDHLYCREHAADVDARLHQVGELLPRITADLSGLAQLLRGVHEETWEYLAQNQPDDPDWPPSPHVQVTADAEEVDIDVDTEPGMVRVALQVPAATVLQAVARALTGPEFDRLAAAAAAAEGLNATH